jgi:hypothetical protein
MASLEKRNQIELMKEYPRLQLKIVKKFQTSINLWRHRVRILYTSKAQLGNLIPLNFRFGRAWSKMRAAATTGTMYSFRKLSTKWR